MVVGLQVERLPEVRQPLPVVVGLVEHDPALVETLVVRRDCRSLAEPNAVFRAKRRGGLRCFAFSEILEEGQQDKEEEGENEKKKERKRSRETPWSGPSRPPSRTRAPRASVPSASTRRPRSGRCRSQLRSLSSPRSSFLAAHSPSRARGRLR